MKKYLLIFVCLNVWAAHCFSQTTAVPVREIETDSTKMTNLENAAIANPLFRQGSISTEYIGNANTTADLFGNPLYKGKISIMREKANFNIPFLEWGENNLSGSLSYLNQYYNISHVQDYNPQVPVRNVSFYTQTIGFTLSYTRHDSLFSAPVIYNANAIGYTSQLSSVQKYRYLGAVVFPIKSGGDVFKIGVVVIIDPSAFFPVLPYVSYWHKFGDSNTELLVDLPRSVALRKQLTTDSWLALTIEQTSTYSFLNINEPPLPQDGLYTQVEVKAGPSYEYRVSKKVILGIYGGLFSDIDSRLTKRNTDWSNYYIRNNNSAAPYLNFTVSFLPFVKPLNKY